MQPDIFTPFQPESSGLIQDFQAFVDRVRTQPNTVPTMDQLMAEVRQVVLEKHGELHYPTLAEVEASVAGASVPAEER